MTDDPQAIVASVQAAWAAAFARRDAAALAALYAPVTAFYGSTAALHTDPAGVRAYFEALPPGLVEARFARPHVHPLGEDALAASGEVVFVLEEGGARVDLRYRMSHVVVRRDAAWRIALHHASPIPR